MHQPIIMIGEAPGLITAYDEGPLEGKIGRRLAEYAGLTLEEYRDRTERHNLFDSPIEKWPREEAALNAGLIWSSLIGRRTILLGRRVADAFGLTNMKELRSVTLDDRGTEVAIVPHPSGRNIWWNEAGNRAEARRFLREAFGTSDR